ncbi:MAG: UDP-N-acetylmuramoyl-L-alanyl-D-glutamate--2,6-diaminopimelate ligase [Proteobacteria bacterium]|nr:UDP-N-acetylmuramoyl-L-alanyl-D-glutamate--2,6-diaminopimelate ligase [Pseudomonadota bacterium]
MLNPVLENYSLIHKYGVLPEVDVSLLVAELQLRLEATQLLGKIQQGKQPIVTNSKKFVPGCIFIAIKGTKHDGHQHAKEAAEQGASLIICQKIDPEITTPQLLVKSSRAAWAFACSLAWGHPQNKLKMIGVTGTNGKTSCVWMLRNIFSSFGMESASIGTLGFYCGNEFIPTTHTTPDPDALYGLLQCALDHGCKIVAMEVASHSIHQEKLAPIQFSAVGWTSFTQDHLDLHGTMRDYFVTKNTLFTTMVTSDVKKVMHRSVLEHYVNFGIPEPEKINLYSDEKLFDQNSSSTVKILATKKLGFSTIRCKWDGVSADFEIPFVGMIFAENFLCALSLASHFLQSKDISLNAPQISKYLRPVKGRLEPIVSSKPGRPLVIIDYAHTPDALMHALEKARSLAKKRLLCVFGCGGNRDRSKRPIMGKISSELSDLTIVTDDNPRNETSAAIISEILQGVSETLKEKVQSIPDRRSAIATAINCAGFGDVVLVAGKGHEEYQIIGDKTISFPDGEIAGGYLEQKRRWCVIGAGMSGLASAKRLVEFGDNVWISDSGKPSSDSDQLAAELGFEIFSGGHKIEHLNNCDGVIISPGAARDNILVQTSRDYNIPSATEIDLGFENYLGTSILVTGTNGKSTTCAMAGFALTEMGYKSDVCGNIGLPPIELSKGTPYRVCELSSYQLEQSEPIAASVAMITSFSFDHIARHKTLQEYFRCKWKVTLNIDQEGLLLLRGDVFEYAISNGFEIPNIRTTIIFDKMPTSGVLDSLKLGGYSYWWPNEGSLISNKNDFIDFPFLKCIGSHNRINAAFVFLALKHLQIGTPRDLTQAISNFPGLPFRCQIVMQMANGALVINDSKSTNAESTLVAITSLTEGSILLMGGAGKGESYQEIAKHHGVIAKCFVFGTSGPDIERDLSHCIDVKRFQSMKEAVFAACEYSKVAHKSILFSPGCASFDEFRNFEHRGDVFNDLIREFLK